MEAAETKPTCTVCLIAKDEGPYLLEWVAYYRRLGFDEIIVYDNKSTDGSTELLKALAKAGVITYRFWTMGATTSPQISAYTDAVMRCTTDWILFIDTDEFLVLHHHDNVTDFLAPFHARPGVGVVGINWRLFGDNGMAENDGRPATERFTRAAEAEFETNAHFKSFNRLDSVIKCENMHACHVNNVYVHASGRILDMIDFGVASRIELHIAQVNHYFTRTWAEYQEKKRRGRGGFAANAPEKHAYHKEKFDAHNCNTVEDLSIQRHTAGLRTEMARLETLIAQPVSASA